MAYQNPFTYIPADYCGDVDLPAFPEAQLCTSYDMKRAEICGLIIVDDGGVGTTDPGDWESMTEWEAIIDNTGTDATAPRYIVGRGTFTQLEKDVASLVEGRLLLNRERTHRTALSVLNMAAGHVAFAKRLQTNKANFRYWIHTVENRVIGGPNGMAPSYTDAEFPFGSGDAREQINLILDTTTLTTPQWGS